MVTSGGVVSGVCCCRVPSPVCQCSTCRHKATLSLAIDPAPLLLTNSHDRYLIIRTGPEVVPDAAGETEKNHSDQPSTLTLTHCPCCALMGDHRCCFKAHSTTNVSISCHVWPQLLHCHAGKHSKPTCPHKLYICRIERLPEGADLITSLFKQSQQATVCRHRIQQHLTPITPVLLEFGPGWVAVRPLLWYY